MKRDRIERLERQDERIRLAEDGIVQMRTYWKILGAVLALILTAGVTAGVTALLQ